MEERRFGSRTEQFMKKLFKEKIRKKFIIVIQCDFEVSQNTGLDNKTFL